MTGRSDRPIRVLHVIRPGNLTGAPVAMLGILERLAKRPDYRFEVVCGAAGDLTARLAEAGIPHHVCSHLTRAPSVIKDARAFRWLYAHIRAGGFDVVHTHSSKAGVLGRWAAHLARVPAIIHTFNGVPWLGSRFLAGMEASACRVTDRVVAVSESERATLIEAGVVPTEKIVVIANGVELAAMDSVQPSAEVERLRSSPSAPVVAWVGRLKAQKDPALLAETAAAVLKEVPDGIFVVVGHGELLEGTRARIEELGIGRRVHFLGWRDDALAIMKASTVLLSTSHWEGLPVVAIEAAAMGVPIVATAVRGNVDAVVHEKTGLLAPRDPAALADQLRRVMTDAPLRAAMSAAAAGWAREQFDIASVARATDALYRETLEGRGADAA